MDFRIYDKDKTLIGLAFLGPDLHSKLSQRAQELRLPLVSQLKEYYGVPQKEFFSTSLNMLYQEFLTIAKSLEDEDSNFGDVANFIHEIEALSNLGKKQQLSIIVVAE